MKTLLLLPAVTDMASALPYGANGGCEGRSYAEIIKYGYQGADLRGQRPPKSSSLFLLRKTYILINVLPLGAYHQARRRFPHARLYS